MAVPAAAALFSVVEVAVEHSTAAGHSTVLAAGHSSAAGHSKVLAARYTTVEQTPHLRSQQTGHRLQKARSESSWKPPWSVFAVTTSTNYY